MINMIIRNLTDWYTSKKVTEITTVIGNTGFGKTYSVGKMQEIYMENDWPFGVIDKMGIHFVLRSYYDKVIIIGGDHGDYTIAQMGLVLPNILNNDINFIIDFSNHDDDEVQEMSADLFEYLFEWHKEHRKPRNYMLEECDMLVGQTGVLKRCKDIILKCITKGRMHGFGFTLISQRFTMIHKTALGQSRNYISFNLQQDLDLKRLNGLTGQDVSNKVRKLNEGECLIVTRDGFNGYNVGTKKSADKAITPEVGVKLVDIIIKPLNVDVENTISQ